MKLDIDQNNKLVNVDLENEKKVIIPKDVISTGVYSFHNKDTLEELLTLDTLKKIEDYSFDGCKNLHTINLTSVEEISVGAFRNCSKLVNINLSPSLKKIEKQAFLQCSSLKQITIPDQIKEINEQTFAQCLSLKQVNFSSSLKKIKIMAFYGCENLKEIRFPSSLKTIETSAFAQCENIEKIVFSSSIKEINDCAFENCKKIEKIFLPYSLTHLGKNAFYGCDNLKKVYLPDSLTDIGNNCFANCRSLELIEVSNYFNLFSDGLLSIRLYDYYFDKQTRNIIISNIKDLDTKRYIKIEYEEYEDRLDMNKNQAIITKLMFNEGDLESKEIKQIKFLLKYLVSGSINKDNYQRVAKSLFNSKEYINLIKHASKVFKYDNKEEITTNTLIFNGIIKEIKLYEVFKLAYPLGAFCDDQIKRQRACEFIKNAIDKEIINKNNIHSICDKLLFKEFDSDFASFFMDKKNFIELINYEKEEIGSIAKICNTFDRIKEYGKSNKGSQHYRKVTVDMCREYFAKFNFEGVNEDTIDISEVVSKYTRNQSSFDEAVKIRKEYLKLKEDQQIDDHLLSEPLKEKSIFFQIDEEKQNIMNITKDILKLLNDLSSKKFTYEYLSKNDPLNFVLGKYCSCCAHIEGVGYSVMKASILHPSCQNLIIRDDKGIIVAKSTLYINKEQGYGVFNNIEVSDTIEGKETMKLIYKKYMQAINDFVKKYNQKNANNPLKQINVGMSFNSLEDYIKEYNTKSDVILKAIDFSKYGKFEQSYNGDWQECQYILFKKK